MKVTIPTIGDEFPFFRLKHFALILYPFQSDGENGSSNSVPRVSCIQTQVKAASVPPRELSPSAQTTAAWVGKTSSSTASVLPPLDTKTWKIMLPHSATAETTAGWLAYNRYGTAFTVAGYPYESKSEL